MNIRRNLKSGETTFRLTDTLNVYPSASGSNCYAFLGGFNYVNLQAQISSIAQWATLTANWSLFRINGIKIRAARMFNENIGSSLGVADLPSPPLYINYYPSVTGQTYSGATISETESSFRVDPYVAGVQSKYITIPKNFSNLTNGIGLGTWNPTISLSNMVGQISCGGAGSYATAVITQPSFEL